MHKYYSGIDSLKQYKVLPPDEGPRCAHDVLDYVCFLNKLSLLSLFCPSVLNWSLLMFFFSAYMS